jgi:hypothetical protein
VRKCRRGGNRTKQGRQSGGPREALQQVHGSQANRDMQRMDKFSITRRVQHREIRRDAVFSVMLDKDLRGDLQP